VAYLLITVEGKPPTRRSLDGPTIIGRAMDSAVWIDDSRLSRQHCRIEAAPDGTGWMVIDLNSKNGTVIKGERISAHKLVDGDEICVGRARVVFHARSEPPQRPSTPVIASGPVAPACAPSPADTLVDSRFPIPKINPHTAVSNTGRLDRPHASHSKAKTAQRPLAFQRPPARPLVDHSHLNFLTRMWRRFRSAVRRRASRANG
jgi:FHA domain